MGRKAEKTFYFNRELSWLEFNNRVLEEGLNKANPLLERLKFLSIVSSNFDEFFMIRVASIKELIRNGHHEKDPSGLTPEEVFQKITKRSREICGKQYACFSNELLPALADEGLVILRPMDYDIISYRWLEDYFATQVEPILTPLAIPVEDESSPISGNGQYSRFPTTSNLRIHAAFILHNMTSFEERLAIIQVPSNLTRFIKLPGKKNNFALLDDLVMTFGDRLFPGFSVHERTLFKVTRNADIGVDEDIDDFIAAMEEVLVNRQKSWPVRLIIAADSEELESKLCKAFDLSQDDIYPLAGPIDLASFIELANIKGFDHLRYKTRKAILPFLLNEENTIWDEIRKRDIVLHLPYESFSPVVSLINEAAKDSSVLAIKMTLYRTSGSSPIVKALINAARAGKQVTVIVELKARFDEERNITWASTLEQAGAIVVYGIARLKIHAKATLVIRREEDGLIRRYAHLSTGNYNEKTASLYQDLSIFTVNSIICEELSRFFNIITGLSSVTELPHLAMSPFNIKKRIISMIEREAERSSEEAPGQIMVKVNSLGDRDIIDALYKASCAGVRILLNVRGICQLIPGIKNLSENITVVSIVGRYLEHSRIIYFRNGGNEELYLSSADWMPRNLDKRIELMFPVHDTEAFDYIYDVLASYFLDNTKARQLFPSGYWKYIVPSSGEAAFSVQDYFYDECCKKEEQASIGKGDQVLPVRRRRSGLL